MWSVAPAIFDDEDEDKLKADFIRLCALYPNQDILEISSYVFRNQRDPSLRSEQAATIWLKDLDVLERIRIAKLNGGAEPSPIPTKEARMRQLQKLFEDVNTPAREKIAAARLIAEMNSEITKAVEKKITNERPKRQIIFAQAND